MFVTMITIVGQLSSNTEQILERAPAVSFLELIATDF